MRGICHIILRVFSRVLMMQHKKKILMYLDKIWDDWHFNSVDSTYVLPRFTFWLSLSSCSYISLPNVISDSHCSMHHLPCYFVFSCSKKGMPKWPQNVANLSVNIVWKFQKFTVNSIPILVIKDWKMSLYKPIQVKSFNSRFLICEDNFYVDFFCRHKFCHI